MSVFLYADDILLIAPSVSALQTLLHVCEEELRLLDMQLNIHKSVCIRFGARFKAPCKNLASSFGGVVDWNNSCRYLGVFLSVDEHLNAALIMPNINYSGRSFNTIFSKIGRFASEEVVISLTYAKCIPVVLYGTEASLAT